ncbi:glycosyltransferase family 4 protein [Iningainema tapete]|uniref:Glycosyltransferase n=1 Tax=Iningainema tapete BLCC-T55 TaxID=2748662 RepID=A0A8J7BZD3_9CYAN|nr:glycosyltransferase [Iningainema tapete]MBD2777377.1 glycosyltransferase [Iningainema tapete BLCC-T55]
MKRLKVLLSAYSCEPGLGSEPGIGWNTAKELAKHHQIWVLTSKHHRSRIEAELARNPLIKLHFIYFDPFGWVIDWSNEGKKTLWGVQFHYYLWQVWAYFVARKLHQEIKFDLAHHATYVQYARPSFISLLPIPFIWGPVGGGESAALEFWRDFSWRAKVYETARNFVRFLGELDPFVRITAKRSAVIYATTKHTAQRLYKMGVKNVQIMPESGLPEEDIAILAQHKMVDSSQIRFISMGRLLHWKGFHLGLRAFATADLPNAEYWLLGEGPEHQRLHALAQDLGIAHKVKFWGKLKREQSLSKLGECDILVHPSLHDSGGWVCIEAMAASRPVICLDTGGPGVQVTQETGLKIPAHTPEQAVLDLASAMKILAQDREMRSRMGQAGQLRVRENFVWESKGELIAKVYQEVWQRISTQSTVMLSETQNSAK